jgi:ribosome-binding protein aMBF1 (putative translation factor)
MSRPHARKAPAPKQTTPETVPTTPPPEPERQIPNLGDCLRAIRFKRRLSLADVSAATGIARSTLSRVESNQLSLTYDKLVQLSRGLRIDLAELLSSPADGQSQAKLTRRTF